MELSSFEADDDVFSGYNRREELTIDDLDDLLGEQPKSVVISKQMMRLR